MLSLVINRIVYYFLYRWVAISLKNLNDNMYRLFIVSNEAYYS